MHCIHLVVESGINTKRVAMKTKDIVDPTNIPLTISLDMGRRSFFNLDNEIVDEEECANCCRREEEESNVTLPRVISEIAHGNGALVESPHALPFPLSCSQRLATASLPPTAAQEPSTSSPINHMIVKYGN